MKKTRIALVAAALMLAACSSHPPAEKPAAPAAGNAGTQLPSIRHEPASSAASIDDYKRELAAHISRLNAKRVYPGRPQALLRSVVVLHYVLDGHGRLLNYRMLRSNRDRQTEAAALHSLRDSAPFPAPPVRLMRHGRLEISETWLFNNDGRFQLRSIAEAQMDR